MRSKMEYIQTEERGRTIIKKVGMAPIQRQGMEYEFDIVADMDIDHNLIISKSRCFAVADAVQNKPDAKWFTVIANWLQDGAEPLPEPKRPQAQEQKVGQHNGSSRPKVSDRPWQPEQLKAALQHNANMKAGSLYDDERRKKMLSLMNGKLTEIWAGDKGADTHRVTFLRFIWGVESSKELQDGQLAVMLDWLVDDRDPVTGDYAIKPHAKPEAQAVLRQVLQDAGQQELAIQDATDLFGKPMAEAVA